VEEFLEYNFMKLKLQYFFLILNFSIHVEAQVVKTKAIATYDFEFLTDTLNKNKKINESMLLFIGIESSLYKSYNAYLQDSTLQSMQNKITSANANSIYSTLAKNKGIKSEIFKNISNQLLINREYLFADYYIKDTSYKIKWTILTDTTTINGLKCQKATARFKGRNYTAWFSLDIPISDGPWKLQGLPGLIINAYDDTREVDFKLTSFNEIKDESKDVFFNFKDENLITRKDFMKLWNAYLENPSKFIETNWKSSATNSSGMKVVFPPGYKVNAPNNFIDLSDY
jgi:GLPGLI family protein